jgi:hypothetical protein
MLILFVSLTIASAAQADTSRAPAPAATEAEGSAGTAKASERRDERDSRPRWIPRQARRRHELAPAVTPYPVLFAPMGVSNLPF